MLLLPGVALGTSSLLRINAGGYTPGPKTRIEQTNDGDGDVLNSRCPCCLRVVNLILLDLLIVCLQYLIALLFPCLCFVLLIQNSAVVCRSVCMYVIGLYALLSRSPIMSNGV